MAVGPKDDSVEARPARLEKAIKTTEKKLDDIANMLDSNKKSGRSRARSRSTTPSGENGACFFCRKFGKNAKKCEARASICRPRGRKTEDAVICLGGG